MWMFRYSSRNRISLSRKGLAVRATFVCLVINYVQHVSSPPLKRAPLFPLSCWLFSPPPTPVPESSLMRVLGYGQRVTQEYRGKGRSHCQHEASNEGTGLTMGKQGPRGDVQPPRIVCTLICQWKANRFVATPMRDLRV